MRFTTPIILATLAVLATVQALPTNTDEARAAQDNHEVEGTKKTQDQHKLAGKFVDLGNIDIDVPPEELEDLPEDTELEDLINDCLDDPDLDECVDIDFDIHKCLAHHSRHECFEEIKDLLDEA